MIVNRSAAQLHLENVSAPGEKEKVRRRPTPAQRHSASNWGPGRIAKTVAFAAAAFGQGVQSAVARPRAEPIEGAPGGSAADGKSFCSAAVFNDIPAGPLTSRMSEQDLKRYAAVHEKFVDHDIIAAHYRINHTDPIDFFYGHKRYLACMQEAMGSTPLPQWVPEDPIPPALRAVKRSPAKCFSAPACKAGWNDEPLEKFSVGADLHTPAELRPGRICSIKTEEALHERVIDWHNRIHAELRGAAATLDSPATAWFYPWHNGIDKKIFDVWLACPDRSRSAKA